MGSKDFGSAVDIKKKHVGEANVCKQFFFFQAEDGIRDRSVSRGLGIAGYSGDLAAV